MAENDNSTIVKKKWNNSVLFIEPNHFTQSTLNDNQVEYTHNLDDYCIYCDLECEITSKINNARTKLINIQWKSRLNNGESDTNISWLGGSEYGDTRVLTTSYSDASYQTVKDNSNKQNSDREMFGINSISIKYEAWVTPVVSIKFTDIRGMSLFASEEYSHKLVTPDGMNGQTGGEDITGSFFRALFTFPYPRFKLYIKGFYGHPICYDMAVNKFKATFDSKTGNFGADVDFIGYKFGLLNDVTMTALASAVSSLEGRTYFDNQIGSGRFKYKGKNGEEKDLVRLSYIAYQYGKYLNALSDLNEQFQKEKEEAMSTENERKDDKKILDEIWNAYVDYFQKGLMKCFDGLVEKYKSRHRELFNKLNISSLDGDAVEKSKGFDKLFGYNISYKVPTAGKIELYIPDSQLDFVGYPSKSINVFFGGKKTYDVKSKVDKKTLYKKNLGCITARKLCNDKGSFAYQSGFINHSTYNWREFKFNTQVNEEDMVDTWNAYHKQDDDAMKILINTSELVRGNAVATSACPVTNIEKVDNYNKKLCDDYKVQDMYNNIINKFKELIQNTTNEELEKKYTEVFELFKKSGDLKEIYPVYDKSCILPIYHIDFLNVDKNGKMDTFTGQSDVVLRQVFLSHYTFDFVEFRTKMCKLRSEESEDNNEVLQKLEEERKAAAEELLNNMIDIDCGMRFIMQSLWANVETFLYICCLTKENIFASPRTVESLGFTKENSNLPQKAFDDPQKMTVSPFPTYLGIEVMESGKEKKSNKYLGIDHPDLEECKLVEKLIYGASRYYNWANANKKDRNGNLINPNEKNVYNESTDEIRLGTYLYLQNFFDKWMYSVDFKNLQEEWGADTYFDRHFIFIDVFYNKIGDELGFNKQKLCEAVNGIFEHKNNTLMSFITALLQEVNAILQPTQGFMLNEIENGDSMYDYYDKLFTPIPFNKMKTPDNAPYFVVIYRGDPSKHLETSKDDENDTFMISEDIDNLINERPLGLLNKDATNGYVIPAIGVSYGKQYQSYFTDIDLDMNVQMANEVSLSAQYFLAGVSTEKNGGGQEQYLHLGQDLFTIYANNSYTCTITMLGCMWIQPLMYFQLNNIPMFRGTYMVQKVYHDMTPGEMTTKFTGVRMSRYASPFANKEVTSSSSVNGSNSQLQLAQNKAASFDNDCPYQIFDVQYVGGSGIFTEEFLNSNFGKMFPKHAPSCTLWYETAKNYTVCEAIASIIRYEHSSDEIAIGLHATLHFNTMYANFFIKPDVAKKGERLNLDGHVSSVYGTEENKAEFSARRHSSLGDGGSEGKAGKSTVWLRNTTDEKELKRKKEICDIVRNVFLNSPLVLEGKYAVNNMSGGTKTKLTEEGLCQICSTYGIGNGKSGHNQPKIYIHSTDEKGKLTTCYYSSKNHYKFWSRESFKQIEGKRNTNSNTDTFHDRFIKCIVNTFDLYEGLNDKDFYKFFDVSVNEKNKIITFTTLNEDNAVSVPLLLDILFNGNNDEKGYNNYINSIECNWNGTVNNQIYPKEIKIKFNENGGVVQTELSFISSGKLFVVQKDTLPESFYKILKKKYIKLDDNGKMNRYVKNTFA